jgi:hypothetical protein
MTGGDSGSENPSLYRSSRWQRAKLPKHRTREASAAPAASFKSASGKWDKPIDEQSVALIGLVDVVPCSFVKKSVADHMNRVDMVCKKPTNEP